MDKIEFTVKGGKVTIDVLGASGPVCEMLTKEVEEKLGIVAESTKKPEWYAETTTTQEQRTTA